MQTTGEDIPPELFERILSMFTMPDVITRTEGFVHANKRELGTLSLVCRYWADMCQPKLFHDITLRSREDVHALLALLEVPKTRIGEYIWNIDIPLQKCQDKRDPWLHLLFLLYPKLDRLHIAPQIEGPLPPGIKSLRSIHPSLPRTTPVFSQRIWRLVLKTVHLRRHSDLMRLLYELHDLKTLVCDSVTWPDDTPSELLPSRKSKVPLKNIKMSQCTQDWNAVWLVMALGRDRLGMDVSENDWKNVMASVQFLGGALVEKVANCATGVHVELIQSTKSRDLQCWFSFDGTDPPDEHISPRVYYKFVVPERHNVKWPAIPTKENVSRVENVAVDLAAERCVFDEALNCDWETFGKHISLCTTLQKVWLGFRKKEELAKFIEERAEKLAKLAEDEKLRYALRREKDIYGIRNWLRASLDSDITTETSSSRLYELQ